MIRPLVPVLVTAVLASACDIAGPDPAIGLFELQTVEGASLPYTVEQDVGAFADITAGHIRLMEDGTCEVSMTFVDNMNAILVGTSRDPCTWSRQNIVITFLIDQSPGAVDGTLIGDLLSVNLDGLGLILERSF
jgi:hypothetical protein